MSNDSPAIACARLAMGRAEALTNLELKWGLNGLAMVAALAPWFGVFLSVRGIVFSFRGCGCEKSTAFSRTTFSLSEAMIPTAAGLALAIFAFALRRNLQTRAESLALEMDLATDALLACLRPLEKLLGRRDESGA